MPSHLAIRLYMQGKAGRREAGKKLDRPCSHPHPPATSAYPRRRRDRTRSSHWRPAPALWCTPARATACRRRTRPEPRSARQRWRRQNDGHPIERNLSCLVQSRAVPARSKHSRPHGKHAAAPPGLGQRESLADQREISSAFRRAVAVG